MSLLNVSTTFRQGCGKRYHVTMNSRHILFFAKLSHYCCNVVIPKLRRRFELEVAVTTLYQLCHYNIHDVLRVEFITQHWGNVGAFVERGEFDVVVSML